MPTPHPLIPIYPPTATSKVAMKTNAFIIIIIILPALAGNS